MSEREPPIVPSAGRPEAAARRCAYCGTVIDTSDWHPITKRRKADGSLALYYFDSEHCLEAWHHDRDESVPID